MKNRIQINCLLFTFVSLMACHLTANEQVTLAWWKKNETVQQSHAPSANSEKDRKSCDTTLQNPPDQCAYNAPVLPNPSAPANLYVTGAFLYWKASADYLAYALLNNSFSTTNETQNAIFNGKVLEPEFKYKPGYKIGLGYKIHRDRWDLYTEYTSFHQHIHRFKEVNPGGQKMLASWVVLATPAIVNDLFRSCSSSWRANLDLLDGELGRNFFLGRYLTLRPALGLRGLWLKQTYNLTYLTFRDGLTVNSHNKSHSKGVGPRISLDTAWNLYKGFKVLGDMGASLLYVKDHVTIKHTVPSLNTFFFDGILYANKETISVIKPILDLSLGLAWGRPIFDKKCAFDLQLTYDYSIYWDQGAIQLGRAPVVPPGGSIQVVVGNVGQTTGNLSIQGLTAKARFDF